MAMATARGREASLFRLIGRLPSRLDLTKHHTIVCEHEFSGA